MRDITEIFNARGRPFLIAEVGLGHDGSLGMAHAYIDAVATTGADAVKFQTHIAGAESSAEEPFRVKFSYQDATRYGYWERTSFTAEQWAGLKAHADEKDLVFLSSPFSAEAVDLLENLGVVAWKIASGELGSRRMLGRIAVTGKPVIASTGMSAMEEVKTLVATLQKIAPARHAVLQCTTEYPTPPAHVGMNIFDDYRACFECPIGLSDHSGTVWPSLIATSRGARVLEVHVTMSRQMFGPDVSSSLTVERLAELVQGLDFVHTMLSNPLDKDAAAMAKAPLRKLFGKSAMAVRAMQVGEVPDEESVAFRKPGTGLDESAFDAVACRPLVRPVAAGTFFQKEDFQ
jgi:N,N'-diacetyllegionaminate synthase